ncbi:helix-turn-helix domain-containing protein [Curtobacterium sp. SP.BCp]|uniref:helix-turn-helix domain-containing protein n=1 Tax=Curtobacterium sp. SP.BCp TaxID=3435230 RepID=UPI003F73DC3E
MPPVRSVVTEDTTPDPAVRDEAADTVERAHDRQVVGMSLTLDDGTSIAVPGHLAAFLVNTLRSTANGSAVVTVSIPEELTTTTAAKELGISRPTLMKLIRAGAIPSTKVGTHTRLRRRDVLELRQRRDADRRAAARDVRIAGEAFD